MKISSVAEYKQFAERHNLPLNKMRFALERKYAPRWFYLYYDSDTNEWVVAKNKDDGTTAVRYRGPSQSTACQILFDKMEEEARKRGYLGGPTTTPLKSRNYYLTKIAVGVFVAALVFGLGYWIAHSLDNGYYVKRSTGETYYYMGGTTYKLNTSKGDWYLVADPDDLTYDTYNDYYEYYDTSYYESTYDSNYYGSSSNWHFSNTSYYEDYHTSTSSDSDWDSDDYSSWDSSDTDWGSDW